MQALKWETWRWIYECVWEWARYRRYYFAFVYKQRIIILIDLSCALNKKQWPGTWVNRLNSLKIKAYVGRFFFLFFRHRRGGLYSLSRWILVFAFIAMHFPCSPSIFPWCQNLIFSLSLLLECDCDDAKFMFDLWACVRVCQSVTYWACTYMKWYPSDWKWWERKRDFLLQSKAENCSFPLRYSQSGPMKLEMFWNQSERATHQPIQTHYLTKKSSMRTREKASEYLTRFPFFRSIK